MKMHLLSGGRLNMRRSVYHPGAAREERIDLPVICALNRHAQGNVLLGGAQLQGGITAIAQQGPG